MKRPSFQGFITRAKMFMVAHKFISAAAMLVIVASGYGVIRSLTSTSGETRYVTANVARTTIVVSISGSGQVAASQQVDIKSKVSGTVLAVPAAAGQTISAETIIARIDPTDAQKAVRDAQTNLDSAKIALAKLTQPADTLSLTQAHNILDTAQVSLQNAQADFASAYEDGFNNVANTFLDVPAIMTGLQNILYTTAPQLSSGGQWNIDYYANTALKYDDRATQFRNDVNTQYQAARTAYTNTFTEYKGVDRTAATSTTETLIGDTYTMTRDIAQAVKSANNLIQFYEDTLNNLNLKPVALADTHLATLNTYTGQVNTHLSALLLSVNTIANDKNTISGAQRSITEDTESLQKLQAGADPLDVQSAQLTVTQRQNALDDAQTALADYAIRAPFDGVLASVAVNSADTVSSGTTMATLITSKKVAELSLNEVDAAKIKVGDKATLTFDAIDGLTLTGSVAEIDPVGTVTQGVVTYDLKILFDTQDDRVKPGMTVNAAIITGTRQDVLSVPSSAVKTQNGSTYVQVFDQPIAQSSAGIATTQIPRNVAVTVGVSNDTTTEIIEGLTEGQQIVTRTIAPSSGSAVTSQAPSLFGAGGSRSGTGGAGALRSIGR